MVLLRAKGIYRRYLTQDGYFYALRSCDLSFPSKGLFAIKGKSGSGKSTLLNLLSGIERPSGGHVYYQGEDIAKRQHPLLGYEAAMVFQHYNLIEGESALYNAALPRLMKGGGKEEAKRLLRRFGLQKSMNKSVSVLSGGEKQRVALCRAMVNDPKIVFADEPTGALDEENSRHVMETLKEISKTRLVLLVSHNEELIRLYADHVLDIGDGRLKTSTPKVQEKGSVAKPKFHHSSKWVPRFVLRNLKRNLLKDSMCFLAGFTGFISLLLSFGYFCGNIPAFEKTQSRSLTFLNATIAQKEVMEVPGSTLKLVKRTRPSDLDAMEVLDGLEGYHLEPSLGYFFASSNVWNVDGETYEPTPFEPLYDITLQSWGADLISEGTAPTGIEFDECVVNQEFLDKFGREMLGKTMAVRSRSIVETSDGQQEVFVEARLRICCVVKEFAFLNTPRVYYSYPLLAEQLSAMEVEVGDTSSTNLLSLVENASPDSAYSDYQRLLFLNDSSSVLTLFAMMGEDTGFDIVSSAYSVRESYQALSTAFESSLTLFVGIAFVGLCLILGMACLSSFVAAKKESAVLSVLGARGRDISRIYRIESLLLCVGSAAFALILSPLLQRFLNVFLEKEFDVAGVVNIPYAQWFGIPLFPIIASISLAALTGLLSSYLPMRIHRRLPLAEELRDE